MQQHYYNAPQMPPDYNEPPRPPRRRGRFRRVMRGYLMTVGALTTLYGLVRLLILLFIEIGRYLE